jgi:hypothetical protein
MFKLPVKNFRSHRVIDFFFRTHFLLHIFPTSIMTGL